MLTDRSVRQESKRQHQQTHGSALLRLIHGEPRDQRAHGAERRQLYAPAISKTACPESLKNHFSIMKLPVSRKTSVEADLIDQLSSCAPRVAARHDAPLASAAEKRRAEAAASVLSSARSVR